jgi:hypothetical protein
MLAFWICMEPSVSEVWRTFGAALMKGVGQPIVDRLMPTNGAATKF